jgi:beta-galactosidase
LLEALTGHARAGGRVVLDMPGAYLDERAHLLDTRPGSAFETLFGAVLHEYAYCNNVPFAIDGVALEGFTSVLTPTSARVVRPYDNGWPAITENAVGAGTAVVLGAEASMRCLRPGNREMESLLVRTALGPHRPSYGCEGAIAYRLAASQADHYFLINDGPARSVTLEVAAHACRAVTDPVAEDGLKLGEPIDLDAHSARWLRFEKRA